METLYQSLDTRDYIKILNLKTKTIKGIFSILDQYLDHVNFVYICMKLKEWKILNGHAVMFDT